MQFNKIAAAVLLAGLIAMISGKVSTNLYYAAEPSHGGHGEEQKVARGYSIEVSEANAGDDKGGAAAKVEVDILPLLATADAAKGGEFFAKKCSTCHSVDKGGKNKTGPLLWGVVNRPKGAAEGFKYSKALAGKGGNWDYQSLSGFLHKPKAWLPGTIMAYAGIENDAQRADVVAYLRSLSDAPAPLTK